MSALTRRQFLAAAAAALTIAATKVKALYPSPHLYPSENLYPEG